MPCRPFDVFTRKLLPQESRRSSVALPPMEASRTSQFFLSFFVRHSSSPPDSRLRVVEEVVGKQRTRMYVACIRPYLYCCAALLKTAQPRWQEIQRNNSSCSFLVLRRDSSSTSFHQSYFLIAMLSNMNIWPAFISRKIHQEVLFEYQRSFHKMIKGFNTIYKLPHNKLSSLQLCSR